MVMSGESLHRDSEGLHDPSNPVRLGHVGPAYIQKKRPPRFGLRLGRLGQWWLDTWPALCDLPLAGLATAATTRGVGHVRTKGTHGSQ